MTWKDLLNEKRVMPEPPSKGEMDNLRSIVSRNLTNMVVPGLAPDIRFILAYDVARTLSLMIVRAEGYRPRAVAGHYNTFLALEAADAGFASLSAYFNDCRAIRNESEYDFAGGVSETDADQLLQAIRQFTIDAEAWIATHHPHLV